jgi:hypothetical protein
MISERQVSRNPEGGYALLMIFLMAAIVALMLYQQLPRVAFETEREKEQLLIDRGEQYIRAIQLYYIANNRQFPTSIEDLEKREKRFLRRRYLDPYTGKDEWRIIHGNGTFLTDSLVQKAPGATDSSSQSASTTNPTAGEPQVNAAVLQRPSDRPNTPAGFNQPSFNPQGFQNGQDANGQPVAANFGGNQPGNSALPPITLQAGQAGQPGGLPPITLAPAGGANQAGGLPPITLSTPGTQPGTQGGSGFRVGGGLAAPQFPGQVPGQVPGQIPGQVPSQIPGQVPGQFPGQFPGQTGPGGLPGGIQTGVPPGFRIDPNGQLVPITAGQQQQGIPGGTNPAGIPGQQPSQQPGGAQDPNSALNLINQLLTNPRQTPTVQTAPTSGNQIGAIAGIASTHKGPSIKVYKDQDHYELWEFVFTPTAATAGAGGVGGGGVGGPGGRGANQPGGQPNGQPTGQQGPFGQPGGFGGQPGPFGQPGGLGGRGPQIFAPGPGR